MPKLTDTQLIILSAASQRDDRGVELPANVKGEAARKAVDKLIRAGLLEEVRAAGSLPVWRRDDDSGPMALRITKKGLDAIDIEGDAVTAPKKTSARPDPVPSKAEGPAAVDPANIVCNRSLDLTADLDGLPALPLFMSIRAAVRAHVQAALNRSKPSAKTVCDAQSYLSLANAFLRPGSPCPTDQHSQQATHGRIFRRGCGQDCARS